MNLEPKQVICKCGHSFIAERERTWCEKCCRPVFYHDKDQKLNAINAVYFMAVFGGVMVFLTYMFIELIATPLL